MSAKKKSSKRRSRPPANRNQRVSQSGKNNDESSLVDTLFCEEAVDMYARGCLVLTAITFLFAMIFPAVVILAQVAIFSLIGTVGLWGANGFRRDYVSFVNRPLAKAS